MEKGGDKTKGGVCIGSNLQGAIVREYEEFLFCAFLSEDRKFCLIDNECSNPNLRQCFHSTYKVLIKPDIV